MTDRELAVIAETKGIQDVSAFDSVDIQWPGRQEWKVEVLEILEGAQREEDKQLLELEKLRQEKEAEKERVRLEREKKLEQKRLGKELQNQHRAKEQAQRETQQAKDKEEYDRRVAERQALADQRAATHAAALQQMEEVSGGHFPLFPLLQSLQLPNQHFQ